MNKYKCDWKEIYENNQRGRGTSFSKNAKVACQVCDGYQFGLKDCYFSVKLLEDMRDKFSQKSHNR